MQAAIRDLIRRGRALVPAVAWAAACAAAEAATPTPTEARPEPTPPSAVPASGVQAPPPRRWIGVPRLRGRLTAADVGLVVNTADPY
ncbi:MAG: hypothetical protein RLZZ341_468, partial [Pseudomonadota bacterium]